MALQICIYVIFAITKTIIINPYYIYNMRKFLLSLVAIVATALAGMAEPVYCFVGAFNGWNKDAAPEFVQQADGTYKIDNIAEIVGAFKVIEDHSWNVGYASNGSTLNIGEEYKLQKGGGDVSFTKSASSFTNCSLTLRKDGDDLYLTINGTEQMPEVGVWCLCGIWNGWNIGEAPEFTKVSENVFEINVAEFWGTFGIFADHSWNISFKKNATGANVVLGEPYVLGAGQDLCTDNQDMHYTNVKMVLDLSGENATLTMTAESGAEPTPGYQLVGAYNGWALESGDMTLVGEGLYEIELDKMAGEFKITKNRSWNNAIVSNGSAVEIGVPYYASVSSESGNNLIIGDGSEITDFKLSLDVTNAEEPVFTVTGLSGAGLVASDAAKVKVQGGTISVAGAENVAVYTTAGTLVSKAASSTVASGLYIVVADGKVQKVAVK